MSHHDLATRVKLFPLRLAVTAMRSRSVVRKFQSCFFERKANTKLLVVSGPMTKRPLERGGEHVSWAEGGNRGLMVDWWAVLVGRVQLFSAVAANQSRGKSCSLSALGLHDSHRETPFQIPRRILSKRATTSP